MYQTPTSKLKRSVTLTGELQAYLLDKGSDWDKVWNSDITEKVTKSYLGPRLPQ